MISSWLELKLQVGHETCILIVEYFLVVIV